MIKSLTAGLLSSAVALALAFAAPSAGAATLPPEEPAVSPDECALTECTPTECDLAEVCGMPADCEGRTDCNVTARRQADGTCLIECTDEKGETCSIVVDCEEASCEVQSGCSKPGASCPES